MKPKRAVYLPIIFPVNLNIERVSLGMEVSFHAAIAAPTNIPFSKRRRRRRREKSGEHGHGACLSQEGVKESRRR